MTFNIFIFYFSLIIFTTTHAIKPNCSSVCNYLINGKPNYNNNTIKCDYRNLKQIPLSTGCESGNYGYFSGNLIYTLTNNSFMNYTELNKLILDRSHIKTIEPEAFAGLPNIINIQFIANKIDEIKSYMFSNLMNLKILVLMKNQIKNITSESFPNMTKLAYLDLNYNEITYISSDAFDDLINLTNLYLGANHITDLHINMFSKMSKLKILDLSQNKISSILSGVFNGLYKLEKLDLGENKLITLPSNIFSGMYSVIHLYIDYNQLTELPPYIFNNMSKIQYLFLNRNNLTYISEELVTPLINLKYLWLYDNNIEEIPSNLFDIASNSMYLVTIDLRFNKLKTIPISYNSTYKLDTLNLRTNHISNATNLTYFIDKVKLLDVYWNQFICNDAFYKVKTFIQRIDNEPIYSLTCKNINQNQNKSLITMLPLENTIQSLLVIPMSLLDTIENFKFIFKSHDLIIKYIIVLILLYIIIILFSCSYKLYMNKKKKEL